MSHGVVSADKDWANPRLTPGSTVLFPPAHLLYTHTHGRRSVPQIFRPPPAFFIRDGAFYTVYPHQISQDTPKMLSYLTCTPALWRMTRNPELYRHLDSRGNDVDVMAKRFIVKV